MRGDHLEEPCASCPARAVCAGRPPVSREGDPYCCFGDWDGKAGCGSERSKCEARRVCEVATKAGQGVVGVTEEEDWENPWDKVVLCPEGCVTVTGEGD